MNKIIETERLLLREFKVTDAAAVYEFNSNKEVHKYTGDEVIESLGDEFKIANGIAIHQTAIIESGVTFKPPIIISANCKIGANSYFIESVFLGKSVKIGPSCEVKSNVVH